MADTVNIGKMQAILAINADQFNLQLARSKEAFASSMSQMDRIASSGKLLLTGSAIGMLTFARHAADLEQNLIRLRAVTHATNTQFESLLQTSERLSSTTKLQDTEILSTMTALAQRGRTIEDINRLVLAGSRLAKATATDLNVAALNLDQAMRRLGSGAAETSQMVDLLAKAANTSGLDLNGLTAAMKLVAPTAKALGVPIEEVTAALDTMGQSGQQGAAAGRMLRSSLVGLYGVGTGAAKELKALGIETHGAEGKLRPMLDVLGDLKSKTESLNETERQQVFGRIAGQGAFALPELLENFGDSIAKYANSTGYVDRLNAGMEASFSTMTKRLKKDFDDLSEGMGLLLLPSAKSAVDVLERLTIALKNMSPTQKQTIAAWLETAVAMSGTFLVGNKIMGVFGSLAQGIFALRGAFGMTAGAATRLTGELSLLSAGLGAIAVAAAYATAKNISYGEACDRLYASWLTGSKNLYALIDAEDAYRKRALSGGDLDTRIGKNKQAEAERTDKAQRVEKAAKVSPQAELKELETQAAQAQAAAKKLPARETHSFEDIQDVQADVEKHEAALKEYREQYEKTRGRVMNASWLRTTVDTEFNQRSAGRIKAREQAAQIHAQEAAQVEAARAKGPEAMKAAEKEIAENRRRILGHGDNADLAKALEGKLDTAGWAAEIELVGLQENMAREEREIAKARKRQAEVGTPEEYQERQRIRQNAKDASEAVAKKQAEIVRKDREAKVAEIAPRAAWVESERYAHPKRYIAEERPSMQIAVEEQILSQTPRGRQIVLAERKAREEMETARPGEIGAVQAKAATIKQQRIGELAFRGEEERAGRRVPGAVLSYLPERREEIVREAESMPDVKHRIAMAGEGGKAYRQRRQAEQVQAVEKQLPFLQQIAYKQATVRPEFRDRDKRSAEEIFGMELAAKQDREAKTLMAQRRGLTKQIVGAREELEVKPTPMDERGWRQYREKEEALGGLEEQRAELDQRIDRLFDALDKRAMQHPESFRPLVPFGKQEREELLQKTPGVKEAVEKGTEAGAIDLERTERGRESEKAELDQQANLRYQQSPALHSVAGFWNDMVAKLAQGDKDAAHKKALERNTAAAAEHARRTADALESRRKQAGGFGEEPV